MKMRNLSSSTLLDCSTSDEEENIIELEETIENTSATANNDLPKLDMAPINSLNMKISQIMNISQKRKISMLSDDSATAEENDDDNYSTCSRCFEEYNCSGQNAKKDPIFLECFHTLCRDCVNEIFLRPADRHKCPLCSALLPTLWKKNLQINYYVVQRMKNKRLKCEKELSVWCKECQKIAKPECTNHEFQELSEAASSLWSKNNNLWRSLRRSIPYESESSKRSYERSSAAHNNMFDSISDSRKVIQELLNMFDELLERKRSVSTQMETIQNELKNMEPYIKEIDSIVLRKNMTLAPEGEASSSGTSSTPDGRYLSAHEKRLKNLRHLSHEKKVNLVKQIRTVFNMLSDIEKYSDIAVYNREDLSIAITAVDSKHIEKLVQEKLQAVMNSIVKTLKSFDPALQKVTEVVSLLLTLRDTRIVESDFKSSDSSIWNISDSDSDSDSDSNSNSNSNSNSDSDSDSNSNSDSDSSNFHPSDSFLL